jgi:hypothetical protein
MQTNTSLAILFHARSLTMPFILWLLYFSGKKGGGLKLGSA